MDEADQAQDEEERYLAQARARRRPTLQPCGRCYYCDETIRAGLFCDNDCASEHEREQAIRSSQGR